MSSATDPNEALHLQLRKAHKRIAELKDAEREQEEVIDYWKSMAERLQIRITELEQENKRLRTRLWKEYYYQKILESWPIEFYAGLVAGFILGIVLGLLLGRWEL